MVRYGRMESEDEMGNCCLTHVGWLMRGGIRFFYEQGYKRLKPSNNINTPHIALNSK
jgi:hypothetical protein